jgi:hypothetical protein
MARKNNSILKDIKLNWWQAGLYKTAAVSFGILLAFYFGYILRPFLGLFWLTFLIPGAYICYLYLQKNK